MHAPPASHARQPIPTTNGARRDDSPRPDGGARCLTLTKRGLDSGRSEHFAFLTSAIFTCCRSYVIFLQSTVQSTSISCSVFFKKSGSSDFFRFDSSSLFISTSTGSSDAQPSKTQQTAQIFRCSPVHRCPMLPAFRLRKSMLDIILSVRNFSIQHIKVSQRAL